MIRTCGECPFFNDGQPLKDGQHLATCSSMPPNQRPWRAADEPVCPPMTKTTLPKMWWPLMKGHSIEGDRCAVCGRAWHLNRHHPVKRSAGELFRADGKRAKKPTIILCGNGNSEGCHGLAHHEMLHFMFLDRWYYLKTDLPTSVLEARELDGWKPVREWE